MKIRCQKCREEFDPATQAAFCRGRGDPIKHYKVVDSGAVLPDFSEPAPKVPRRAEFQSDFRLIWNE